MKPKLRFKEFTDDWEEKKLGEIADVIMGQSPNSDSYNENNEGLALIQGNADIKNGKTIRRIFTTCPTKVCDKNTLIMTVRAPLGELGVSSNEVCIGRGVCAIISSSQEYIYHYLKAKKEKWTIYSQGSTFESVNSKDIKEFKIQLPSLPEQEKIGTFLSLVDQRIEKQERKVALLEEEKKGYMQQIFNQELRFKDEEGNNYPEWEEKKLKDLIDIQMCKRILKAQTNTVEGIPFYKIGTLGKEADAFISKDLFLEYKKKYNYPKINEIMITCSGTVGKTFIFDGKPSYYQDSNIVWLSNDEETVLNKFLYFNLNNINWNFLTSSTITRIYANDIYSLLINIPSLPEQEKIANFLSLLDQRIEKEQEKLRLLKEEKKGLLQQMFV